MPIYEYECQQYGHRFEALVRAATRPECPSCQGTDLTRLLSVFAAGTRATTEPAPGPCRTCGDPRGPGACSIN